MLPNRQVGQGQAQSQAWPVPHQGIACPAKWLHEFGDITGRHAAPAVRDRYADSATVIDGRTDGDFTARFRKGDSIAEQPQQALRYFGPINANNRELVRQLDTYRRADSFGIPRCQLAALPDQGLRIDPMWKSAQCQGPSNGGGQRHSVVRFGEKV